MLGTRRPTIRIIGFNFDDQSEVRFDGKTRQAEFVNSNQLVVTLFVSDFSAPGTITVDVVKGTQISNSESLSVAPLGKATGVWALVSWQIPVSMEIRVFLLVIFMGAVGASIMALQSLADYRGQRKLTKSWTIFYVVRPPLGGLIALVFYLVIRGGFMAGTEVDMSASTPFGIIAVAALVGMFSDKAILKLNEIFTSMFKSADEREEKLGGPVIVMLPDGTVGADYDAQLKATGGKPPYTWCAITPLPAGLILGSDGKISGKPTAETAKTEYTFEVTDMDGAKARIELDMTVNV